MSLIKAASIIAIISLVSKFVGLFREVFVAAYYGTNYVKDAYSISSLLPAAFALIMLAGLNGPFHSSVLSFISKYRAEKKDNEINSVIFTVTVISVAVMSIFSILCYTFAPQLIELISSDVTETKTKLLAIEQLQIMSPIFILSALIGISYGILNYEKVYLTPSLSPIMISLAVILALVLVPEQFGPVALAWGTTIGAGLQILLQIIPSFSIFKKYFSLSFNFRHEGVFLVFATLLPASLSSTIGQINLLIMNYFGSALPEGSLSALNYANFLYQLPLGILLTALLVPLLPMLSSTYTFDDNKVEFKKVINKGLRSIIFVSVPSMVILACSGQQLIQIMFQRGAFNQDSTLMTYLCLLASTISLLFYAFRDLLVRVFYAQNNAKLPFYTSIFSIITTTIFAFIFTQYLGLKAEGLALAVSFVTMINMLLLSSVLTKKIGAWVEKETISHATKVLLASIPLTLFCTIFNKVVNYNFNIPIFILYSLCLGIVGIFCIYSLRLLKDSETIEITDKIILKVKSRF